MVMAFQGFLSAFMSPASALIEAGQSLQEMITQVERVDDVMSYKEDQAFAPQEKKEEYRKLSGAIELRNVTFGYSRLGKPQITDFSMTVKPGQKIAFVGRTGCGKSTLAKLISGLYRPCSGTVTFDGVPLDQIDRDVFTGSVSVIDQDITLFEDTISENIRMWDSAIEDFEVTLAARDAGIYDDIVVREGGFGHKLLDGGRDLSGGQRQRLEIARALAQDPTICIMDEATSALDARTEYDVIQSINARGITCIIIAHRLSTIRDCDEIIVLDKGKIVERGTHDELFALGGIYTSLVSNE
jgi:ABC-type bacteriocin/lantibiotic exporter with double-glycine peptidase domain